MEATAIIDNPHYANSTRAVRCGVLRNLLRWLWEEHGAEKLDRYVSKHPAIRPRNTKATRAEIDSLLAAASPALRLWILLCSDLAIRSGTAMGISPEHYDQERKALTFTSKKGSRVTLPVTGAVAEILDSCNLASSVPFISQVRDNTRRRTGPNRTRQVMNSSNLRSEFRELRKSLGIERKLVLHDLRRTSAVRLYQRTHNVRLVQTLLGHVSLASTIWYLDNELEPVELEELEAIKLPFLVKRKEQIA